MGAGSAFGQATSVVKGTVVDQYGEPLIGAKVIQVGTTNGVATDVNGKFTISVPKGAKLSASFIGFVTSTATEKGEIKFVLAEDKKNLNEIVVIGYGTARRSDVTGSIATVGADKINENPSTNIAYALQGRVAGVDMQQTSSVPGEEMRIRIRGQRSLTASNDPLIVLDGIPYLGNLSDINPSDIKSIDILKDASSTAIYGSRGANGVIMVTTNKGVNGTPARVSYNAYVGAKTLFHRYPMMTGDQLQALRKASGRYQNTLDEPEGTNTDWQDLYFRTGLVHSHNLSVAGGTNGGSYNVGASYYHDEAVVPTQQYDRYNLHANFDQKVGDYVHVGLSSNMTYNEQDGSQRGMYGILSMSPLADPYNADGTLKRTVKMPNDESYVFTKEVGENLKESWLNQRKTFATYNNLFAEVEAPFLKGLKYRLNIGLNYRTSKYGSFTGTGVNSSNPDQINGASITHDDYKNWVVENILSYNHTFAEKHNISATAMYSAEKTLFTKSAMSGQDIPAEYFQYYNIGHANQNLTVDPGSQAYKPYGLDSRMARVMYNYDNRYMFSAMIRNDRSSRLGGAGYTYPAVSGGWNLKHEDFLKPVEWIDNLKIRIGWGKTANQAVEPFSTLGALGTKPYNFGSNYAMGYYISKLPNKDLMWENSNTWNFGVDFTFFNGRLSGTMEYYIQKTNDLLLSVNLPSTAGVSSVMSNVGRTQNKGFELTVNGTILDNYNGWTWEAGLNVSLNRNKLLALANGTEEDKSNGWFVGHPIDVIYDYKYAGLWNKTDADWNDRELYEPGCVEGMIRAEYTGEYDASGKPVRSINEDDRQIQSCEPDFVGGFNTKVSYKNWDLGITGAFQCGGLLISTLHSSYGYLNMLTGRRGNVDVEYWTPENTGARYPNPASVDGDNPKYGSTLGIFSGSYVKLRTITLGYNFRQPWMKAAGISNLRLYATIQNPFVIYSPFTSETGLDPETNTLSNSGSHIAVAMGGHSLPVVGTNSPQTRNFLFGLNLTF